MPPKPPGEIRTGPDRVMRLAVCLWAAALLFVAVRALIWPRVHSLYPTFATAGADWWEGTSAYFRPREPGLETYRYPPATTVLLAALHPLPEPIGGAIWRLLNGAVFLAGFGWWLRRGSPLELTGRQQALALLAVWPFALESLNNGQPNLIVAGGLLAGAAAAAGRRWWAAAAAVTVTTLVKVYPLCFGLLIAACYPRPFLPRLLAALVFGLALPFAFQTPDYVADQYAEWAQKVGGDDRKFWPTPLMYRDLWLVFRVAGVPVTPSRYLALQLAAAAGCAVICLRLRVAGADAPQTLMTALGLCSCWMMLCGPATESATYLLLGPPLAYALLTAHQRRWPLPARWLVGAAYVLLCLPPILRALPTPLQSDVFRLAQPLAAAALSLVFVMRPRDKGSDDVAPPGDITVPAARAA